MTVLDFIPGSFTAKEAQEMLGNYISLKRLLIGKINVYSIISIASVIRVNLKFEDCVKCLNL